MGSKIEPVEEAKIRLAVLKENFEYQDFYDQFMQWIKETPEGVWPGLGFNRFGLFGLRYLIVSPAYKREQIYELISPWSEIESLPEKMLKNILPRLFYEPAVILMELGNENHLVEGKSSPIWIINERGLKSWERLYKVDLTRKKSLILKEFEGYIEQAFSNNTEKSNWLPYKKRNRKETWVHLQSWKLRRQRKNFSEISKILGVTIDAAKKSFYRAYELTQDKIYDPGFLKKEIWRVKKTAIKKTCDTCPDKKTCDTLCPDVLRYVDQDIIINSREKLLDHEPIKEELTKKTKTAIKENTQKLKEALVCPECNTVIQKAILAAESKRCPFCNKKISIV